MRDVSLWRGLLGVEKTAIEQVEYDEDARVLVAHVRPTSRQRGRCGLCRRRCDGYDAGPGRRRWRSLDLGTTVAMLEAHPSPKFSAWRQSFSSVRSCRGVVGMVDERMCPRCGQPFYVPSTPPRGRPQQWCSQACRRAGYEERRAAKNGAITIEYVEKPAPTVTLDEHAMRTESSTAVHPRLWRL